MAPLAAGAGPVRVRSDPAGAEVAAAPGSRERALRPRRAPMARRSSSCRAASPGTPPRMAGTRAARRRRAAALPVRPLPDPLHPVRPLPRPGPPLSVPPPPDPLPRHPVRPLPAPPPPLPRHPVRPRPWLPAPRPWTPPLPGVVPPHAPAPAMPRPRTGTAPWGRGTRRSPIPGRCAASHPTSCTSGAEGAADEAAVAAPPVPAGGFRRSRRQDPRPMSGATRGSRALRPVATARRDGVSGRLARPRVIGHRRARHKKSLLLQDIVQDVHDGDAFSQRPRPVLSWLHAEFPEHACRRRPGSGGPTSMGRIGISRSATPARVRQLTSQARRSTRPRHGERPRPTLVG
jgi:hypothetical protein